MNPGVPLAVVHSGYGKRVALDQRIVVKETGTSSLAQQVRPPLPLTLQGQPLGKGVENQFSPCDRQRFRRLGWIESPELSHQLTADLPQVAQSRQAVHGLQPLIQIAADLASLERVAVAEQRRKIAAKFRVATAPSLQHQDAEPWMHAEAVEQLSGCAQPPRRQQDFHHCQLIASVLQSCGWWGFQPGQLLTKTGPPSSQLEHDWLGIGSLQLRWTESRAPLLVGR